MRRVSDWKGLKRNPNCDGVACEGCPSKGVKLRVGSRGPLDSPFVIVGEGPGATEIAKGLPFIGPSGKMLDDILDRCGFYELGIEPLIINAMQCMLPASKKMEMIDGATMACQSRLLSVLQAHPRKLILTLGSAAMRSVLGNFNMKVTRDRGKCYPTPLAEDGCVVATHPAYVLRNSTAFPQWQEDIRLAVGRLRGNKPPVWTDPTWSEVRTRKQLYAFIRKVIEYTDPGDIVTGDFETDSLDSLSGRILELGITWGDGNHVFMITEECFYENIDLMRILMKLKKIRWNWHNGKFDIRWCWNAGIPEARVDEDTMLLSYALNENGGYHDLDQVASDHLEAPDHKGMLKPYLPNKKTSYRNIPVKVRREYAAKDVKKTHLLHPVLYEQVVNDKHLNKLYYNTLIPACKPLCEVEQYGVEPDMEQVEKNKGRLGFHLWLLDSCLDYYARQHGMGGMNFGSWQQLQTLLYNRMRLGPVGSPTDEKTLIHFQRMTGHPIIDILLKRREVAKEGGTYVNNIHKHIRVTGRIHMTYKIHGTNSGRLAGADPNLLNQPRKPEIRLQYKAGKGKVFVEVDLNQAELRSLAIMSKDPTLLKIYRENILSIHDVTTGQMFATKEQIANDPEARKKCLDLLMMPSDSPYDLIYKEAKMRGKAVNFGIVYGREAGSLAEEFNIPVSEADRWIKAWFNTYPKAKEFIDWCRERPLKQKNLVTVFGRKKRWGAVSGEGLIGLQNEAANFPHQSTASDVMLTTFIETQPVLKQRWDAHIWLELYDAIYFEMDDDPRKVAEAVAYVQEVIPRVAVTAGLTAVPFIGDAKTGYSWGAMKDYTVPEEYRDAA